MYYIAVWVPQDRQYVVAEVGYEAEALPALCREAMAEHGIDKVRVFQEVEVQAEQVITVTFPGLTGSAGKETRKASPEELEDVDPSEYLTVAEAAEDYGVSQFWLSGKIRAGVAPGVKVPRSNRYGFVYRIKRTDWEAWKTEYQRGKPGRPRSRESEEDGDRPC